MLNVDTPEIKFAIETVRRAGLLVREIQSELVSATLTKSDRSPVTVADFASQALVGSLLEEKFPEDVLVAEEDASALRQPEGASMLEQIRAFTGRYTSQADAERVSGWIDRGRSSPSGRFWVLDPIDGTKGFLRGEQYAVALALVEAGQVRLGVLGCPNLVDAFIPENGGIGSLVVAARGQGAWTTALAANGDYRPLHVSKRSNPQEARILRSVESGHTNVDQIGQFAAALRTQAEPVLMDSQAKYAILAAGKGDVMLRLLSPSRPDYREKIWDQAAGSIVLEEAGGRISDLDGRPLDFSYGRTLDNNRGVLATNGWLHEAALEALQRLGA